MSKYISCADTAKIVRKALKEKFQSEIKFSVRCSSGGTSVYVEWTDGPICKDVETIVKQFQGSTFDSSNDLRTSHTSMYEGEEVSFGANYVICTRKNTRIFVEAIVAQYCKYHCTDINTLEITGNDQRAWVRVLDLDYSKDHWLKDLLSNTDGKDMYRAYEAQEERKQAEHDAYIRNEPKRKQEAEAAQKKHEQEEKARQERRRKEQEYTREHAFSVLSTSKRQAFATLGLSSSTATREEVLSAFRQKVKMFADGKGGYTADMDALTQAKERALQ